LIRSNEILLASESHRRKELLKLLGFKSIQCCKHLIDEDNFNYKRPLSKSIIRLAELKADSVFSLQKKKIIIAGDTLVIRAGKIFNKVDSQKEVKSYLKLLSGRKHFVYGGLCVISSRGKKFTRFIKTEVYFNKIEEKEMTHDVLEDGIGKAGGYAIQNFGSRFIKKIRGCYTNVVGISIPELYKIFKSPEF